MPITYNEFSLFKIEKENNMGNVDTEDLENLETGWLSRKIILNSFTREK